MKKTKLVIAFAVVVIMFAVAVFAYNEITKSYIPEPVTEKEETQKEIVPAPDFDVIDENGASRTLGEFKGKPVIINFWATWCPPCKSELPYFESLYKEYGDEVEFMMVNLTDGQRETVDIVKEFISENGYTFPVYYDTEYSAASAYGTSSIPVTVFVDRNGDIYYGQVGAMSEKMLRACVELLIK